MVQNYFQDIFS